MKHTIKLLILPVCMTLASCQQKGGTETESLQHHDDSLKAAIESEVNQHLQHQNDSLKSALTSNPTARQVNPPQTAPNKGNKENDLIDAKFKATRLNSLLITAKAKLEFETTELTKSEQFHVGRTKSEREQQIRQQSIRVQTYQNLVQKIQDEIISTCNKINSLQTEIANN